MNKVTEQYIEHEVQIRLFELKKVNKFGDRLIIKANICILLLMLSLILRIFKIM